MTNKNQLIFASLVLFNITFVEVKTKKYMNFIFLHIGTFFTTKGLIFLTFELVVTALGLLTC